MDDLNTPLGQGPSKSRNKSVLTRAAWLIAGAMGVAVAVFMIWAVVVQDPLGGEPRATATIPPPESSEPDIAAKPEVPRENQPPARMEKAAGTTVTIIDGTSGKRQEVVIPNSAGAKAPGAKP